jgi:hypothetical protein
VYDPELARRQVRALGVNIPDSSPISPTSPTRRLASSLARVLPVRMIRSGAIVSTAFAGTPRSLAPRRSRPRLGLRHEKELDGE